MKRIFIALLAMVIALSCLPALAAEGDAILGHDEEDMYYFNYSFASGDTLYLVDYSEFYTYHVGDSDMKPYSYELSEMDGDNFDVTTLPFEADGQLYALNLITEYGDTVEFAGANLATLELREADETAAMKVVCDVDWSDMVEYYDDNTYPVRPEAIIGVGGKGLIRYYDSQAEYKTLSLDLADGSLTPVDALDGAYTMTKYRDGALLVEFYNYEDGVNSVRLAAYDPASDSVTPLGEVAIEEYSPLQGLAYDADTDTVYCAKGGEVCPVDLQAGEVGEGITDMPLETGSSNPASMLAGGYYAFCSDGAVIRNLDPAQKAQSKLKISDNSWNDSITKAYYRFANAHGDVSTVLSHDYSEGEKVIEGMMNQDDSVDIYVLSTSTAVYDAVFNRGYLMELDGSEKVSALAESMYPTVREGLCSNGHLVALPVSVNATTIGVSEKALEALGLKLEDVPDDWPGFLDFIAGLGDKLQQTKGVSLFYSGYTDAEARYELLITILEDYQRYVSFANPGMGYNTDLLRGLFEKLEQIDFVALGCVPADQVSDDEGPVFYDEDEGLTLLQTGSGCNIGNYYSEYTPVLMRMEPNAPSYLVLDSMVAVINPFTKNPEAALAFIDELVDDLSLSTLYCLTPDRNETIRGESNQEVLDDATSELAALKAEYEQASPEEKQSLELEIRNAEENLEYIESNLWDVSPVELEWYRAHDDNIVISNYNWLYSDSVGEATDLIEQYQGGQITVKEMLEGIDKKVQMMLLEGN